MNPVEADLMHQVEKYSRAKQVKALQLLNQAQAARSGLPTLLQKGVGCLVDLLLDASQRLGEWHVSPGRQRPGQAQQLCRGDGQRDALA